MHTREGAPASRCVVTSRVHSTRTDAWGVCTTTAHFHTALTIRPPPTEG